MFGPNDFRPITSSSEMLGGIPGLNAKQELAWAQASRRAKDYIEKAKRDGKNLVKRTPDGSMNNILGGISGIASGISGLGGLGVFSGGGVDGFSATDAVTMGMPSGQADVISKGGFTYWDTDMPTDSWVNMGRGSSFSW